LTATTTATKSTDPTDCWGEAYVYDNQPTGGGAWGNLTNINVAGSAYTSCTQEGLSLVTNTKNQFTSDAYDNAGNMTSNGAATYVYNAESELTSTAGVTYKYDGDGKRVSKSNGKIYWYAGGSVPVSETDASGNTTDEYIFLGGTRIARRDSSGNVVYYMADHLGTSRIITDNLGNILDQSDFYPFGGERVITASSGNTYKFTGKERDPESNLDNFDARYMASSQGRFMSPDPDNAGVDESDPQTWNGYSYVQNNPLNLTDPLGLAPCVNDDGDDGCTEGNPMVPGNAFAAGAKDGSPNPALKKGIIQTLLCLLLCPPAKQDDSGNQAFPDWIQWPSFSGGSPAPPKSPSKPNVASNHFPLIWAGAAFVPLVDAGPYASGAIGATGAYNTSTKTKCIGGGGGAQVPLGGRSVQGGPLLFGNLNKADSILAGGSINVGIQFTPFIGFQIMGNSSGILAGPTLGITGASANIKASKCIQGKK